MAISVTLLSLSRTETGFQAAGTVADKAFTSSTIKWAGDLIFKITEPDENGKLVLKTLAESEFSRGEKIAVARFLKTERVKFESSELLSVDELNKLTAKELRTLAKSRGITGYSAKGVTKADIVAMLSRWMLHPRLRWRLLQRWRWMSPPLRLRSSCPRWHPLPGSRLLLPSRVALLWSCPVPCWLLR